VRRSGYTSRNPRFPGRCRRSKPNWAVNCLSAPAASVCVRRTVGTRWPRRRRALLASYETTIVEVRRLLRGESKQLRIGSVGSAAHDYLNPALARLRQTYPAARLQLLDLSPGEQITALRRGEIDVALTDQGAELLSLDFFTRKLAVVSSVVLSPTSHPLASQRTIRIAQLKNETFASQRLID
jgi:DNA-binding transcriptional LysR family regulator